MMRPVQLYPARRQVRYTHDRGSLRSRAGHRHNGSGERTCIVDSILVNLPCTTQGSQMALQDVTAGGGAPVYE